MNVGATGSGAGRIKSGVYVVIGAVLAAALAITVAPAGSVGLYVLAGVTACGLLLFAVRSDLAPALTTTRARLHIRRFTSRRSPGVRLLGAASLVMLAGVLAFALAGAGTKAMLAAAAVLAIGAALWLFWPLLGDLMTSPPTDLPPRTKPLPSRRKGGAPVTRALGLAAVAVAAAIGAFIAAGLGISGLLALFCAAGVIALLVFVKDRSVFFTFAAVCSLTFVLHKSFSPQDLQQSGGAISIYLTTFDLVLLVMYGIWMAEGTLVADVKANFSKPVIWIPLAGALFLLPSLLGAPSLEHAAAELFRMCWMYLLYFYFAVRIRTRRHVWAVLGGLSVFAVIELVIVLLQWTTGGVLGLSFLGVPTVLGDRTTDSTDIGRPFGTIIHPVFMGAVLGSLALVALAMGIELRRSTTKLVAVLLVPVCLVPLYIAQTRASLVAVAAAAAGIVVAALVRKHLQWRTIRIGAVVAAIAAAVFFPQLQKLYEQNFGTNHYSEEVASRLELNDIAGHMISDHWLLGVGLNNFELVEPAYEPYRVIFFGNPVHNLYLLFLAETGIVGFTGVVLVGLTLYNVALRLARSRDRLLGGVGIGVAGAMAFLMIEELLGFSLRQDIPLAMYWLLGGLAVSCHRLAGPDVKRTGLLGRTRPAAPEPRRRLAGPVGERPRKTFGPTGFAVPPTRMMTTALRRRRVSVVTALVVLVTAVAIAPSSAAATTTAADPLKITFTAVERATGVQGIFTANGDGTGIRRITPADGRFYNWPRWAFGGSRIVFTVRTGSAGSPEDIETMNPDGSDVRLIQHFEYRVAQPSIDPTGRWLTFTAQVTWFAEVAVFRMDLRQLLSANLTAVTSPLGGFDSDPTLTRSGGRIVLATSDGTKTAVELMDLDGTNRQTVTHDPYFNADPDISPDEQQVVATSYRGSGNPSAAIAGAGQFVGVHSGNWHLVLDTVATGSEKVLTAGADCTVRTSADPCTVPEMSAFVPRFTPDGRTIGFTGALNSTVTCICALNSDGSKPRAIILSADLAIDWFDWVVPSASTADPRQIGTAAQSSRILLTLSQGSGRNQLVAASADLMHRNPIALPAGLEPDQARWGPDRSSIVFTARVPVPNVPAAPHPSAPVGTSRRDHFTLSDLDPTALAARLENLATLDPTTAQQQVFLRTADGNVRQLTDPWIEDYQDGVGPGDARSNTNPVFSPDGRYAVVTNTSTTTGESFLLRIDLRTGAVLNLTNATSGAIPVTDADAAYSPDGSRIAFAWTDGTDRNIYLMNAADGSNVTPVTTESSPDSTPEWLPDGSGLIFTSARTAGYSLVQTGVSSASRSVSLTVPTAAPTRAVVAPDGMRAVFVAPSAAGLSLFVVPLNAGANPLPQLLQADPVDIIHFADWR